MFVVTLVLVAFVACVALLSCVVVALWLNWPVGTP